MPRNLKSIIKKIKDFTDTKYGVLIFTSWVILIICFIIKIFGWNIFEFDSGNAKFDKFCEFVETKHWLKMVIACIINLISCYSTLCVMLNKKKMNIKEKLIFIPLLIIKSIISWYSEIISLLLDTFIMLVITSLFNKKILRNLICMLVILIFQIITIVFRNLSFDFNNSNTFIEQMLYQVDYYIMILLFYLHNFNEKEKI